MKRTVFKNRWLPYLLVLPQVAVTVVFFFWPALKSLQLSVFRVSPFGDRSAFVGLENFAKLLVDPEYYASVVTSFVFAGSVTALSVGAALVAAGLATQKIRGLSVYRTLLLWPYGIAPAVAGIIFLFIFHPAYGILPYFLSFVTTYEFNWLLKGWVAMALVVTATAWTHLGYNIAFYVAGLLAIPGSVLEAADVDGAGPLRRFTAIVFPLISPITFYLVVLNMVFAFFESFGVIDAVTKGGPGQATEILVYKLYKDGFIGLNLGSSGAQSVLLMALVIGLTVLQFRFAEKKVTYSVSAVGAAPVEAAGLARPVLGIRRRRPANWHGIAVHGLLVACIAAVAFPLYYAFVISTQDLHEVVARPPRLLPSSHMIDNYAEAWRRANMGRMLFNSAVMAVTVAVGKIAISMLSAFAIVYFSFRGRTLCFWMIFLTLMLPVPVRLMSTYEIIGTLGWINSYQGLTIPLMASATATFLFRQFYLTIPNEMAEAAQLDGAGPLRFLWSFLLPLSWANIAALFVVLFIFGWNQYLWPLMITNTEAMRTVVIGLEGLIPRSGTELPTWNLIMAGAMMALLPPVAVIVLMQRWFVKGLVESEK